MSAYQDRSHAGRVLASVLRPYAGRSDVIVLALPRGGVPVAYEVATRLEAPLDAFVVRKLGVPGREELAMGALASGGVRVVNADIVTGFQVSNQVFESVVEKESLELARRERAYRGNRTPLEVAGKVVLLIDNGLATGASMRAAAVGLRQRHPKRIVVGVPIAAPGTCQELAAEVDEVVCAKTPEPFRAVGLWYKDFSATTDEQVFRVLEAASRGPAPRVGLGSRPMG